MSAALSSAGSSRKRKLASGPASKEFQQKYYAVRAGVRPGVYMSWTECQRQIAGFKGAQFKSFISRTDAEAFAAGKHVAPAADSEPRFYAVAVGTRPGIYTDWPSAQQAIQGAKGPKYKRFSTRQEAADFIRTFGGIRASAALGEEDADDAFAAAFADPDDVNVDEILDPVEPPTKRTRVTGGSSQFGGDGLTKVYTDGSSASNGRVGAMAGVGVYFGPNDSRNVSEPLEGMPQTNQRAELTAVLRALERTGTTQALQIISDSRYSINCVTEWYINWQRNGWRTKSGPVQNRDLVEAIRKHIDVRNSRGTLTDFKWVKGHGGDVGNEAADRLAVAGAKKPRRM